MKKIFFFTIAFTALCGCSYFDKDAKIKQSEAQMYLTGEKGQEEEIGLVVFNDTKDGLKISVNLHSLPAGEHGFHVHEKPSCAPMVKNGTVEMAAMAGGHYDPARTKKHLGPNGGGHKGDLPRLTVNNNGTAKATFYLKDVKAGEFKNRALMIHAGGDNYSDTPAALGGGCARIACGIIQ
ncbi:MAG: superoxide dismutase family protein [Lactobacillales bacterium]|jgi:Cu-Zn family superoxide dismutase|nr:superoxide dismutase family protein [Lactobacillales bacterium]